MKFSFLITIFSLFVFTACGGCGSNPQEKKKGKSGKSVGSKPTNNLSNVKKVVVLFHGLKCPDDSGIADLKSKLGTNLKNAEIIILKRNNSDIDPTTQQAEEAYIKLKEELEKKNLIGNPTCLIGDSHGGLVALELYRQHKNDLNIVGIITNHSPLEGAPGVNVTDNDVATFKQTVKVLLESILLLPPVLTQGLNLKASELSELCKKVDSLQLKEILTDGIQQPVVNDLTKNSTLLNNVAKTLSSIQIPVLVLAGYADILTNITALLGFASQDKTAGQDLATLRNQLVILKNLVIGMKNRLVGSDPNLQLLENGLKLLEEAFGKLIGDKKNDSFIPFYSQCAEHVQASATVQRWSFENYHHFYGMTTDQVIYDKIVNFINKVSGPKK